MPSTATTQQPLTRTHPPRKRSTRARSADQKLERRQAILDAADTHLADVGFEAFSMASLARSLGLAKGTLYLYFETREEVLLALFVEQMDHWAKDLEAALQPGMSDALACTAILDTAIARPNFLPLLLRLNAVIEHNISLDTLVDSKRAMRDRLRALAAGFGEAVGLTETQSLESLLGLAPLLMGSAQHEQGPALAQHDLPQDVIEFIDSFAASRTFVPNACRIVRCIRDGY